ncbi:MAG: type II secretion system F family protein [Candidatus Margulisiibacteriota bacterium]
MPSYAYVYRDVQQGGKIIRAHILASSILEARSKLKNLSITPLSIREESRYPFALGIFRSRVPAKDIVTFTQLFASALRSGMTIKETLRVLQIQIRNKTLKARVNEILTDLETGSELSDAFAKHVDIFPEYYPTLMKAGEASGKISEVLDYAGTYAERMDDLRKEFVSTLTYPAIVMSMAIILMGLVLVYVAPNFQSVFSQANLRLPLPTQILFFMSDVLVHDGLYLLLMLMALLLGFTMLRKQRYFKRYTDQIMLKIPIFGPLLRDTMVFRFLKTFDIMVNNNVAILKTLKVLEDSTSNLVLQEIINRMRQDVSKGLPMSAAIFQAQDIFQPIVAYSISVGERSGDLGGSLNRLSQYLDREITYSMKLISSRVDPLLTSILGAIVLFLALSIYLPIFDMASAVR